jgi:hypothetical protein
VEGGLKKSCTFSITLKENKNKMKTFSTISKKIMTRKKCFTHFKEKAF